MKLLPTAWSRLAQHLLLLLACATLSACAQTRIVEEVMRVPVKVIDPKGQPVEQSIVVTVFHDQAASKPAPLLILNHGRSPHADERTGLGRARLSDAARWLTGFGFTVAVPTRVGYGVSGGPDVEESGACNRKAYAPAYQAAADQSLQVLAALRQRPGMSQDRAIVMGQSFGGTTAITLAAMQPAGVQAAINFAGGGGGNPETRPRNPCSPKALAALFESYGKTARMPTLWVYSENDLYFGATLPPQWFAGFKAAGGQGAYQLYPPYSDNGHMLFSRGPELWQPRVQQFLATLGYRRAEPSVSTRH